MKKVCRIRESNGRISTSSAFRQLADSCSFVVNQSTLPTRYSEELYILSILNIPVKSLYVIRLSSLLSKYEIKINSHAAQNVRLGENLFQHPWSLES